MSFRKQGCLTAKRKLVTKVLPRVTTLVDVSLRALEEFGFQQLIAEACVMSVPRVKRIYLDLSERSTRALLRVGCLKRPNEATICHRHSCINGSH